jgi:hypothetical protein
MLWIPFCVGFRAASECLTFSRLWTWWDLTLAPWLWWRPTALKLRKKLGITPRSMERMWVCTSLGALTGEFSACPSSYETWQAVGWCSATTHVLQAAIRQYNWLLPFGFLLLHFVDVASIHELNAGGLFCHVKLLVLMSSVKKGSHDGVSSKLPGPRSMAWGEMRFAPKRSERCVAVATARSSLTKSRSSCRYIFRFSYEIGVCPCSSASVLSRLFLVLQIALRHAL